MLTVEKYASGTELRMESRVRCKVQARFGEGDTPHLKRSTVPTLLNVAFVVRQKVFGRPADR